MQPLSRSLSHIFDQIAGRAGSTDLADRKTFHTLIAAERTRVDRGMPGFALVLFELPGHDRHGLADTLAARLRARCRVTDVAGWYQRGCVGVLLPATGARGASALAEAVAGQLQGEAGCSYSVACYPMSARPAAGPNGRHGESTNHRAGHRVATNGNAQASNQMSAGSPAPATALAVRSETLASGTAVFDQQPERQPDRQPTETPVLAVSARPAQAWKRLIDLAGAGVGLILLVPLFVLFAAYLKLVSPGPVFFRQQRVGYLGRQFPFFKFRTMHVRGDNDAVHRNHYRSLMHKDVPMQKLDDRNDSRIVPGARLLRKAGIDELPQLINVLRGEMSLVGPRPCLPYEAEEYRRWHRRRFDVLPGLTGLWQVSGKDRLSFQQMMRLDARYAHTVSPWRDLRILAATLPAIYAMVAERGGSRRPAVGDRQNSRQTSLASR